MQLSLENVSAVTERTVYLRIPKPVRIMTGSWRMQVAARKKKEDRTVLYDYAFTFALAVFFAALLCPFFHCPCPLAPLRPPPAPSSLASLSLLFLAS